MDESLRYDIGYSGSQKVIYTPKSQYLTWSNEDKTVTQKLLTTESNPRIGNGSEYGISYMEKFRIGTKEITNLNGEHIWNPGTYYAETEMPGVETSLVSVTPKAGGYDGDGDVELYNDCASVIGSKEFSRTIGDGKTSYDYGTKVNYNQVLGSVDKVGKSDLLSIKVESWDSDDGLVTKGGEALGLLLIWIGFFILLVALILAAGNAIDPVKTSPTTIEYTVTSKLAGLLLFGGLGLVFGGAFIMLIGFIVNKFLKASSDPDFLGSSTSICDKDSFFGADPHLENIANDGNITIETKYELKTNQLP